MCKYGLPERTLNDLLDYFSKQKDIEKVIIYGSRVKGTYHKGSDVDFAIVGAQNLDISRIYTELDELPTPYTFDVLNLKTLSHKGLIDSINSQGQVFYKRG